MANALEAEISKRIVRNLGVRTQSQQQIPFVLRMQRQHAVDELEALFAEMDKDDKGMLQRFHRYETYCERDNGFPAVEFLVSQPGHRCTFVEFLKHCPGMTHAILESHGIIKYEPSPSGLASECVVTLSDELQPEIGEFLRYMAKKRNTEELDRQCRESAKPNASSSRKSARALQ